MRPYYESRGIAIYHGDCVDVLPSLPKVAAVVTDPPYAINVKSDGKGKINPWGDLCNAALWFRSWIELCRDRLTDAGCLWSFLNWRSVTIYQKASCDMRWPIESLLVWDKGAIGTGSMRGLRTSYELVALFAHADYAVRNRSLADVQRFRWSSRRPTGHPAEKPVELMRWLVGLCPAGVVLDPFSGSGTTLVAAKQLGRTAIGIDADERCCEMAAKRLEGAA